MTVFKSSTSFRRTHIQIIGKFSEHFTVLSKTKNITMKVIPDECTEQKTGKNRDKYVINCDLFSNRTYNIMKPRKHYFQKLILI